MDIKLRGLNSEYHEPLIDSFGSHFPDTVTLMSTSFMTYPRLVAVVWLKEPSEFKQTGSSHALAYMSSSLIVSGTAAVVAPLVFFATLGAKIRVVTYEDPEPKPPPEEEDFC